MRKKTRLTQRVNKKKKKWNCNWYDFVGSFIFRQPRALNAQVMFILMRNECWWILISQYVHAHSVGRVFFFLFVLFFVDIWQAYAVFISFTAFRSNLYLNTHINEFAFKWPFNFGQFKFTAFLHIIATGKKQIDNVESTEMDMKWKLAYIIYLKRTKLTSSWSNQ